MRGSFLLISLAAMLLSACASKEPDPAPPQEEEMIIAVDFRDLHRCSRISPEITVTGAPKGTRYYDVRLLENGEKERYLGGGSWQADGTGIIPEGALTRHYTGPCPKAGKAVEYMYVVGAMENENGQPLAVRLYRFTPE